MELAMSTERSHLDHNSGEDIRSQNVILIVKQDCSSFHRSTM